MEARNSTQHSLHGRGLTNVSTERDHFHTSPEAISTANTDRLTIPWQCSEPSTTCLGSTFFALYICSLQGGHMHRSIHCSLWLMDPGSMGKIIVRSVVCVTVCRLNFSESRGLLQTGSNTTTGFCEYLSVFFSHLRGYVSIAVPVCNTLCRYNQIDL